MIFYASWRGQTGALPTGQKTEKWPLDFSLGSFYLDPNINGPRTNSPAPRPFWSSRGVGPGGEDFHQFVIEIH